MLDDTVNTEALETLETTVVAKRLPPMSTRIGGDGLTGAVAQHMLAQSPQGVMQS